MENSTAYWVAGTSIAVLVGLAAVTYPVAEGATAAERHSLSSQASERVLHFASLAEGQGEDSSIDSSNAVFDAKVNLTDGGSCSIQYRATTKNNSWKNLFGLAPNHAEIVNLGSCKPA